MGWKTMEKQEAAFYDICYILAERIKELEIKMEFLEKGKQSYTNTENVTSKVMIIKYY